MKHLILIIIFTLFFSAIGFTQKPTEIDSLKGADLIVLRSGKVIRAKVLDIGVSVIKYKQANYINGPVYSIYRSEVYAINYPNDKADYFMPVDSLGFSKTLNKTNPRPKTKGDTVRRFNLARSAEASLGVGFFRLYSKGEDFSSGLKQKSLLPSLFVRYSAGYRDNIRLGVQIGVASYTFEGDQFSPFDQIINSGTVDETIFSIMPYIQYTIPAGRLQPYIIAGIGLNFSNIDSQRDITRLDEGETNRTITNAQNTQLGILLRGGATYSINDNFKLYLDLGTGLSILQTGIIFRIQK